MQRATPAIELNALTKRYGKTIGVERLDITVNSGEVFGFLGPNGAGKTTTIRCLVGLLRPTSGRVRVLGSSAATKSTRTPPYSVDRWQPTTGTLDARGQSAVPRAPALCQMPSRTGTSLVPYGGSRSTASGLSVLVGMLGAWTN